MEHTSDTNVVAVTAVNNGKGKIINDQVQVPVALPKRKKKRGAMHLIRVALYMLRRKSDKSKAVDVATKGPWRKFLGSIRLIPFHDQNSLRQSNDAPVPMIKHSEEVFTPPISPAASKPVVSPYAPSCSEDSMSSKYASALNLQELDTTCSDEEYDDIDGDKMIDVKAEEFINQFYEQMRIQNALHGTY